MLEQGDFFPFLVLLGGMAAVPFVLLVATSFVKISVVMMILRNALGVQQTPPNIVIYAIALALTIFIMQPIANQAYQNVAQLGLAYEAIDDFSAAAMAVAGPFRGFLERNTEPEDLAFFVEVQTQLWQGIAPPDDAASSLTVLTPAFLLSELTRAFKMGFLLYLPFLAVDLVITTILMAMGMQQVSPTVVAVPFKLLLFVALDGWTKLVHGLVLTYV
ncbi:type III secretion system export apparatus subunit SctR [Tabrizicola aquatica]|uniref:type III secretion system export apparatus subunit SctR n=1 Tax=Tabrizicola aquatica TaxID=909926 RepID=UPI000CD2E38D|nr:type III secretion system export apparatus subunit SctR [Tabrizicola aquatica]